MCFQLKTSIAKQLGRSGEGGLAAADRDVLLQKVSHDDAFDAFDAFNAFDASKGFTMMLFKRLSSHHNIHHDT